MVSVAGITRPFSLGEDGGSAKETEMNKMVCFTNKLVERNSFRIRYVTGDLFTCPAQDALAHCISEDCRMGAGIAVSFRRRFQSVQELLNQKKKTGDVAVLKAKQRYIYYLITKKRAYQKPTYDSLQSSLEAMMRHCLNNGVRRISMPRIGCGLDKLNWDKVAARIQEVFKNTDIQITVYSLETPAKVTSNAQVFT
ncbi:ADP-ribose glycohydrolase OARD1-like isoform X1 [Carcharodon carcharias]|uniref:ADP-ribose glycohydrolase OARD1-like isoform X1 n=2 Tax=Carcharodon carcharias TaxID=13397 RepID=UPI001B7DBDA1|nr:ADP-ribose glycohydrolase OARD1-like isoform X1 [Carcharodon carcharias]